MSELVKVSKLPEKLPWVEGVDYTVTSMSPQYGDDVRFRPNVGSVKDESFFNYAQPGNPQPKKFEPTSQRRALVFGKAALLDKKGKYLEATALRATIGE